MIYVNFWIGSILTEKKHKRLLEGFQGVFRHPPLLNDPGSPKR